MGAQEQLGSSHEEEEVLGHSHNYHHRRHSHHNRRHPLLQKISNYLSDMYEYGINYLTSSSPMYVRGYLVMAHILHHNIRRQLVTDCSHTTLKVCFSKK